MELLLRIMLVKPNLKFLNGSLVAFSQGLSMLSQFFMKLDSRRVVEINVSLSDEITCSMSSGI